MSLPRQVLTRVRRGLYAALADLPTSASSPAEAPVRESAPPPPAPQASSSSSSKSLWTAALPSEVEFWDSWFRTKGREWPEDYKGRLNPDLPLQDFVENYLPPPDGKTPAEILDVGAGPLTLIGKRSEKFKFRITPVDPLADFYIRIMEKHGVVPPVPTSWCHGELLSERFGPESFDLVWAQNSLDHSYEPVRIIEQALTVARVGGYVVLAHNRNEAVAENYEGLHQWNFDIDGTDFVIWNQQARVNVTKLLSHRADIRTTVQPTFLEVSFRKTVAS